MCLFPPIWWDILSFRFLQIFSIFALEKWALNGRSVRQLPFGDNIWPLRCFSTGAGHLLLRGVDQKQKDCWWLLASARHVTHHRALRISFRNSLPFSYLFVEQRSGRLTAGACAIAAQQQETPHKLKKALTFTSTLAAGCQSWPWKVKNTAF